MLQVIQYFFFLYLDVFTVIFSKVFVSYLQMKYLKINLPCFSGNTLAKTYLFHFFVDIFFFLVTLMFLIQIVLPSLFNIRLDFQSIFVTTCICVLFTFLVIIYIYILNGNWIYDVLIKNEETERQIIEQSSNCDDEEDCNKIKFGYIVSKSIFLQTKTVLILISYFMIKINFNQTMR